jgi:hypothetical protein
MLQTSDVTETFLAVYHFRICSKQLGHAEDRGSIFLQNGALNLAHGTDSQFD